MLAHSSAMEMCREGLLKNVVFHCKNKAVYGRDKIRECTCRRKRCNFVDVIWRSKEEVRLYD